MPAGSRQVLVVVISDDQGRATGIPDKPERPASHCPALSVVLSEWVEVRHA